MSQNINANIQQASPSVDRATVNAALTSRANHIERELQRLNQIRNSLIADEEVLMSEIQRLGNSSGSNSA